MYANKEIAPPPKYVGYCTYVQHFTLGAPPVVM